MRNAYMKLRLAIVLLPLAGWLVSEAPQSRVDAAGVDPSASNKSLEKLDHATRVRLSDAYGRLPLSFEANHGQMNSNVRFFSRGSGYGIFITPTEAVLSLAGSMDEKSGGSKAAGRSSALRMPAAGRALRTDILRMKLVGANQKPQVTGLDELPGKMNYFIGNDPKKWRRNITSYAKVKYQDVYPGIDLVHYGNQRQLEYDFLVKPGADPRTLRLGFAGAEKMEIDRRGDLLLRTAGGEVRQHKPVVYQEVDGVRKEIQSSYVLLQNKAVAFEIGTYDRSKSLIIDPVLSYSTYLGGTGFPRGGLDPDRDYGQAIAVDSGGNAYVTGFTASTDFPTANPIQGPSYGISYRQVDAFVSKLNPTGSALVYSTYLGGSEGDIGYGIAVDTAGNAYITGLASSDFPTVNPLPGVPAFGGFVAKLNASGSSLVYSTHLGDAIGRGIAVDAAGNACFTGSVYSSAFPIVNAFQGSFGGNVDAFVAKINAAGSALVYSSYLGGSNFDQGTGIAVSPLGNAYVTGFTSSLNFPTVSPLQASFGGLQDAFVFEVDSAGSPIYSTYIGGEGFDSGRGIAVDSGGNAYVTGVTRSPDFPTTVNVSEPDPVVGLFKTTSAGQNWFSSDRGLGTRSIKALAPNPILPTTIFAGAFDGVYKSTDSGATWTASSNGLGYQEILALALDKNGVKTYAGTNGAGVYRSMDGGASWTAINAGLPAQSRVQAIATDPQKPLTLYLGTFGTGAFKSIDGGLTWTDRSAGLGDSSGGRNVSVLAISPKKPSTLYAGTESGVFKSTNGGASWAASGAGIFGGVNALLIDPSTPSTLYAATGGGLFKTTNGGAGWTRIPVGLYELTSLAADPDHPATIYAGGLYYRGDHSSTIGVFKSTDGGSSWALMNAGLPRRINVAAIAVDPANPANIYSGIVGIGTSFGFIAKLNPRGSILDYSTYLGAEGSGIGVDSAGNAYVTGFTEYGLPIVDPLPFMGQGPGAFITKLSATGSTLLYSSFVGGFGSEFYPDAAASVDAGTAVAVDPDGNAYMTGVVENSIFPVLNPLPHIVTWGSAFVTKISNFTPAPASKWPRQPFQWTVTTSPAGVITTGQSEVTGAITMTARGAGSGANSSTGAPGKIELLFKNPALQIDNGVFTGMRLLFTPGFTGAFTATQESGPVGIVAVENRTASGQCYGVITINMAAGATVRDGDFIRIEGVRTRIDSSAAAQPGTDIYLDIQPLNGQAASAFTPNRINVARSFDAFNISPITQNGASGIRIEENFAKAFLDLDANDDEINQNDRLDSGGGNLLTTVGSKPVASFPQALGLPSIPTRIQVLIENIAPGVSDVTFPETIQANEQSGAVLVRGFSGFSPDSHSAGAEYEFQTNNQAGASDLLLESFDIIPVYTLTAGGTATGLGIVSVSLAPNGFPESCGAPNRRQVERPRYIQRFVSIP